MMLLSECWLQLEAARKKERPEGEEKVKCRSRLRKKYHSKEQLKGWKEDRGKTRLKKKSKGAVQKIMPCHYCYIVIQDKCILI